MALEINIHLKGLNVVLNLLKEERLPVLVLCIINLHRFMWGSLCWQEFGTIQPLAIQHKQLLSLSAAVVVIEASSDLTGNYFVFVNDYHSNLATDSWLKRVFPIHHYPCEETTISGPCLTCIKTHVLLPCLSLIHKHNSSTGVGGNIFFSLLRRMLRLECVG